LINRIPLLLLLISLLAPACRPGLAPPAATPAATPAAGATLPAAAATRAVTPAPATAPPAAATPPATPSPAATVDLEAGDPLPPDPAVRMGELDNGLHYYIRRNREPAGRAQLWLAVDAGSILEDEDQRGLAHFLEHMLFNGTRRFPGQELIAFLESTGMEFGPDVNAFTSFDETVYMLHVPTGDEALLQDAFDVLEDWAAYATLSEAEIDKERGVVVEEWRLSSQNAGGRILDRLIPVVFAGSRYAERLPIGQVDVIRDAPPEAVRRFYRTWYRPELMAVLAVGDFDVDRVEALVREHFASLPRPADPPARPTFDVPGDEGAGYLVATDPEYPFTSVEILYKGPARVVRTDGDFREQLAGELFDAMLNDRLAELGRRADAPFLFAGVGRGSLARPADVVSLQAAVEDEGVLAGLEALLVEAERAGRHGFAETELDRAGRDLLRGYEQAYDERENIPSEALAGAYLDHFLRGGAIPGASLQYELARAYIPGIRPAEVSELAAGLVGEDNRTVLVVAPEKEGLALPGEVELAAVVADVRARAIPPYADTPAAAGLMPDAPTPASVVSRRSIDELGVTEIELENGARVVMKPTDFRAEEVLFGAASPGGSSLVSDADFPEASLIASAVAESGAGEHTYDELVRLLAGRTVSVSPFIDELHEGLSGRAATEDLETLFQLIHLYVAEPRLDPDAFEAMRNQMLGFLENLPLDPQTAFSEAVTGALYGDTVRRGLPTVAEVEALDPERAFDIYRERFADAGDFTFIFVGSFDQDELTALARTYLGTLPAAGREERWRDVAPDPPAGVVEEVVRMGRGEQSLVEIVFAGPFEATPENRHRLQALEAVLSMRIREELREERGGVYSPGVSAGVEELPDPAYSLSLFFGSDPARVEELTGAAFGVIRELQTEGPAADKLAAAKEQARRNLEEALEENGFWLSELRYYAEHPGRDPRDLLRRAGRIQAVTAGDVQRAAQEYLPADRYVRVVLYPEGFEGGDWKTGRLEGRKGGGMVDW
jgi:zinc protease